LKTRPKQLLGSLGDAGLLNIQVGQLNELNVNKVIVIIQTNLLTLKTAAKLELLFNKPASGAGIP
jgi:hypothetical protein